LKRCRYDTIALLLEELSKDSLTKLELFRDKCNINYSYGNRYLKILLDNKLIDSDYVGMRGAKYRITEKGRKWLQIWKDFIILKQT